MSNTTNPVFNDNPLKLGIFCINGRGAAMTTVPEQKPLSWDGTLKSAVMADRMGFEAIVPFARWKGYVPGKPEHVTGRVYDPYIFAAAIAQATNYSGIFATSHVPTVHPIMAAKQCATIDHISGGRFGLNVVAGWNQPELEMFGNPMKEHTKRYDHAEEWLLVLRRLWSEKEEFDHSGEFFNITGGMSEPKPIQPTIPIMNAGGSDKGQDFAVSKADMCFIILRSEDEEMCRKQVEDYKTMALEKYGRDIQVWIHTYVVQRDSQQEAEAYLQNYAVTNRDEEALAGWMAGQEKNTKLMPPEVLNTFQMRFAAGAGGFPLVGTAGHIANRMEMLSRIGVSGALLTWVDFHDGLSRWGHGVMPLLEQAGLRKSFQRAAA
ncbi:LLM class flavin-dependent oxidoreductase [Brucella anthropi]|uniref:LLM class flavin-dependent oxidoreductase n=1 Tax=Brucella anthropi TaxID=529 RepID=A0A6I0DKF9_BRUAN|nr:LLM class flavin-dependent oxidoreductase [Brucella anthropi]KAB2790323.1 LLM class flavin-dependent oxidoreductase [Brucella anthropi]